MHVYAYCYVINNYMCICVTVILTICKIQIFMQNKIIFTQIFFFLQTLKHHAYIILRSVFGMILLTEFVSIEGMMQSVYIMHSLHCSESD